jgi:hypothetical protein
MASPLRRESQSMPPHVPKYVSPKQAAEDRARRRAALYWIALAIPLIFILLLFGYSDQAPAALRSATITLDQTLGYPIARLLGVPVAP